MISYAVKGLDSNPIMSSTLLLSVVYALSIAPNFTNDAYLKLLPVFLIPAVMIASSDTTGFALNVELLLGAGILTAGVIKLLTMYKPARERLKRPQSDKFGSSLLYVAIFGFFMAFYVGIGMSFSTVELHAPQPQPKSAFYFLIVFLYIVIALASVTGFRLGFGGGGSKSKTDDEPVEADEEEE